MLCHDCSLEFVSSSDVARSVYLFYMLSRLQAGDAVQSAALLQTLPGLTTPGGRDLWTTPQLTGQQGLLQAVLQTAVSLLITNKALLVGESSALRSAAFNGCFVPLACKCPFAHAQTLRLLLACT